MKKIFLSGDPTHPLYHRYQNVAAALESVFEAYEIACVSEHFETFETQDYEKYDLAVLYTDHWIDKTGTSHQQVQALKLAMCRGGALNALMTGSGSAVFGVFENMEDARSLLHVLEPSCEEVFLARPVSAEEAAVGAARGGRRNHGLRPEIPLNRQKSNF